MANKIKLGERPKTFKPVNVKFPMPDGTEGVIQITYKYRTRTEFGQLVDGISADAGAAPEDKLTMQAVMSKTGDKHAEYLLQIIESWDLDVPANAKNLRQLADELPAAAYALIEAYRAAVLDGRLGN